MNFSIVLSGGIGTRMRTDGFPKQYLTVNDKPILVYTLEKINLCDQVDKIIIVADVTWHEQISKWIKQYGLEEKFASYAAPGSSRQGSILSGLKVCMNFSDNPELDKVVIHDAVRPLVTPQLLTKCLNALDEYEGCMPVLSMTDTTYYSEDGHEISSLLDRDKLFAGQAPEAFRLKPYYNVNMAVSDEEIYATRGTTEIAYKHGLKVCMIPGDYGNFKLTTPSDLDRFRAVLESNLKE